MGLHQPYKCEFGSGVAFEVAVAVEFKFPLGTLQFALCRKWIRNERCLSEASFVHFPFLAMRKLC
jgi:hypothetical protein